MQNHNQSKGSTLLLAMVIISTVLFAGIGVGTILSRQIREIATMGNEAVAFYIAESVVDNIDEGFEDMDYFVGWDYMSTDREVEYKVTKMAPNKYEIIVGTGNDYYKFIKEKTTETVSGDYLSIYYDPGAWENVDMMYGLFNSAGTNVSTWTTVSMNSSDYGEWKVYEFEEDIGEDIVEIRIGFGAAGGSITDSIYYLYKNSDIENYFYPYETVFSNYNENNYLSIYYDPGAWENVDMMYGLFNSAGTNVSTWTTVSMNSSDYGEWKVYEFEEDIGEDIVEIRIGFGAAGGSITDSIYYLYKNSDIENYFYPYENVFSPID